jgi:hypothetical protein
LTLRVAAPDPPATVEGRIDTLRFCEKENALRSTEAENPRMGATVICEVPAVRSLRVIDVGFDPREKSGPTTVKEMDMKCDSAPLLPSTSTL